MLWGRGTRDVLDGGKGERRMKLYRGGMTGGIRQIVGFLSVGGGFVRAVSQVNRFADNRADDAVDAVFVVIVVSVHVGWEWKERGGGRSAGCFWGLIAWGWMGTAASRRGFVVARLAW